MRVFRNASAWFRILGNLALTFRVPLGRRGCRDHLVRKQASLRLSPLGLRGPVQRRHFHGIAARAVEGRTFLRLSAPESSQCDASPSGLVAVPRRPAHLRIAGIA